MKGEWCYFKSYFSKEMCEKIISEVQVLPIQDGYIGTDGGEGVDYNYRRSKIRFINSGDWRYQYIFDALWRTALEANRDFFNLHITKLDFIQFAEYDETYLGEYKEHHDVFWINNDPIYHRKLSCVIQLSDPNDYVGGELELTETSVKLDKDINQQGTFIYFPSLFRHKANPVTRGTRYSIAAWFEGPKWR
jgi:PKHD-type hydroxylase